MLDSVNFPQHCSIKITWCSHKLTWFRNCFFILLFPMHMWALVQVMMRTAPKDRKRVGLVGTHTFPRHRHYRLPGSHHHWVQADDLMTVWCEDDRRWLGSLQPFIWALSPAPRQATHLGALPKHRAKGSQGKGLPICHFLLSELNKLKCHKR